MSKLRLWDEVPSGLVGFYATKGTARLRALRAAAGPRFPHDQGPPTYRQIYAALQSTRPHAWGAARWNDQVAWGWGRLDEPAAATRALAGITPL